MIKTVKGIEVKKRYGQHFLRNHTVIDHMIDAVSVTGVSVMEIGCGEGVLTRAILQTKVARLWVFEIDPEWASYVKNSIQDERLAVHEENILDIDPSMLEPYKPWTLLANLPYQITFPILHLVQRNRHLFSEGVVMVQEEVAQKITKTKGKGYGYSSLFFQYYFEWKQMDKIAPSSFFPPPKVYSRLLYFKVKQNVPAIAHEEQFWQFIKLCFRQPRRTLKNNLAQTHYDSAKIPEEYFDLRAQQISMEQFLALWALLNR
ncbi:MAG: 16S rRNA (adenine(1518)-N(6)/adenine(1519)-N(6))-dimethyltransferase RsmA [Candidatus Babeliales bacterium]